MFLITARSCSWTLGLTPSLPLGYAAMRGLGGADIGGVATPDGGWLASRTLDAMDTDCWEA